MILDALATIWEGKAVSDKSVEITDVPSDIMALYDWFSSKKYGVEVKDRSYRLKTYRDCFIGSEAVDWCMNNLNLTKLQAFDLCEAFWKLGLFSHVVDVEKPFFDGYYFYQFTETTNNEDFDLANLSNPVEGWIELDFNNIRERVYWAYLNPNERILYVHGLSLDKKTYKILNKIRDSRTGVPLKKS